MNWQKKIKFYSKYGDKFPTTNPDRTLKDLYFSSLIKFFGAPTLMLGLVLFFIKLANLLNFQLLVLLGLIFICLPVIALIVRSGWRDDCELIELTHPLTSIMSEFQTYNSEEELMEVYEKNRQEYIEKLKNPKKTAAERIFDI